MKVDFRGLAIEMQYHKRWVDINVSTKWSQNSFYIPNKKEHEYVKSANRLQSKFTISLIEHTTQSSLLSF